jgi:hypothetical protein
MEGKFAMKQFHFRDRSSQICNRLTALCAWIIVLCGCTMPPPPSCEADYLIYKINEANSTPLIPDTIDLPAGCTYTLTKVNNRTTGNNGLPTIDSPIIINGHGSTIQRSPNATERFRLFYVNSFNQSDLTLYNLTLTGGNAYDPVIPNFIHANSGGAIYNGSHLTVKRTIIKENSGREGGGIYNQHMMTLKDVIIDSNEDYFGLPSGAGIHNRGTGIIINSTISHNGFDSFHPGKGIYMSPYHSMEQPQSDQVGTFTHPTRSSQLNVPTPSTQPSPTWILTGHAADRRCHQLR